MTATEPSLSWVVVFTEQPHAMRILAVHAAPEDPDAHAELCSNLWVNRLSFYAVQAATGDGARRTARQHYDVERIRAVRARRRTCQAQRRPAPLARLHGPQAVALSSPDLDLNNHAVRFADRMATAALRSGFQHRTWPLRDLTFAQYLDRLPLTAASILYRYAALTVMGRTTEAVALLVNALAASTSDL
ncbi:hypothetical protein [Streptomyces sp. NPDC086782]|uniref:hypothetical protein n=1 Tax=Streptomyces sp. NPDC086782 TaxID=3365757 RepID=UPI0037FC1471